MRKHQKAPAIPEGYITEVEEALRDWQTSQRYFECVSDPDLVDYAIFQMEAARRRYMYLLKRQKQLSESDIPLAPKEGPLLSSAQRYIQIPGDMAAPSASNQ